MKREMSKIFFILWLCTISLINIFSPFSVNAAPIKPCSPLLAFYQKYLSMGAYGPNYREIIALQKFSLFDTLSKKRVDNICKASPQDPYIFPRYKVTINNFDDMYWNLMGLRWMIVSKEIFQGLAKKTIDIINPEALQKGIFMKSSIPLEALGTCGEQRSQICSPNSLAGFVHEFLSAGGNLLLIPVVHIGALSCLIIIQRRPISTQPENKHTQDIHCDVYCITSNYINAQYTTETLQHLIHKWVSCLNQFLSNGSTKSKESRYYIRYDNEKNYICRFLQSSPSMGSLLANLLEAASMILEEAFKPQKEDAKNPGDPGKGDSGKNAVDVDITKIFTKFQEEKSALQEKLGIKSNKINDPRNDPQKVFEGERCKQEEYILNTLQTYM